MAGANGCKDLACGNGAAGIGLKRIVGGGDILAQPAVNGGIPLLQRAQAGTDDFAGRGVGPEVH